MTATTRHLAILPGRAIRYGATLLGLLSPQLEAQQPSRLPGAATPVSRPGPTPTPVPPRAVTAAPPSAGDPAGFTATIQGKSVVLTWQPVPGISWYLLGGPGIGSNGQQVQGTSYTVGPLDPGPKEWTVASLTGDPRAPVTNWANWPKAQVVIENDAVGSYRISVAGFRVNRITYDDQFNRDGWGDEVYASVVLQRFNRATGALLASNSVTSSTHGDATSFPDRVPQGSRTGNGGLKEGDVVPFGWDQRSAQPPAASGRFPLKVWEGSLADGGDVLVLRPTLWELDGDRTAFDWWLNFLATTPATRTWGLPGLQLNLGNSAIDLIPGIGRRSQGDPLLYGSDNVVDYLAVGNRYPYYINSGRDRPIGLHYHSWLDWILVLDREKIEAELRRAGQVATPAGLIALPLQEQEGGTQPLNGDYVLYLRVERK